VSEADRSLIAGANALFRAAESRKKNPILRDAWASALAERDPRIQAIRYARFAIPALMRVINELQTAHCVRHRAIDEMVLSAIEKDGFRQVVVVGAGYDMRASRFAERVRGVRWIEADHPATQARKQRILAERGDVNRAVASVGVELMRESLAGVLRATGFDRALPTLFVAEGIVHYLSLARAEDLVSTSAHVNARARFIMSFIRSDMVARASTTFTRLIKIVREVPRLHFYPTELESLLAHHGLRGFESLSFDEQVDRHAPEARGRRATLSQDVAVAER
jgi:methyltransferase (TIGR00027 family)